MKRMVIGIAGPSGCGKTTIAHAIVKRLPSIGLTGQAYDIDCCYKDLSHLSIEERSKINFDHPNALDLDLCARQLSELKKGLTIEKPIYDFTRHNRKERTERREPSDVVIAEGIHTLSSPEIRQQLDFSIYVTTNINTCLRRRRIRDINERGRTPEFCEWQIETTVLPMYEQHIFPSKRFADRLIDWDGDTSRQLQTILDHIKEKMSRK
jgi:uridine kinase